MTELVPSQKHKVQVPMAFAAMVLSQLCDQLDDGADPTEALVSVFRETQLDLADAIDRRICFATWIEGAIDAAKNARDSWGERARKLDLCREAFRKQTADIIKAHPDLPYQGQLGRLAIQANPPRLDLSFELKAVTNRRAIDDEVIAMFGIDEAYIKTETVRFLDTDAVKLALKDGADIPWAKIETDSHLRIRK